MQQSQPAQMPLVDQFKQQMLKAWQPVPSLTKTIVMFFLLSAIFLGLGIPMLILSQDITENTIRYDTQCTQYNNVNCSLTFQIPTTMSGPVFVYYQLNNYYQNHRLYAKSINTKQLLGRQVSLSDVSSDCTPIVYNKDLYVNVSINGTKLDPQAIANPCGIIAYTIFNDTFYLEQSPNNFVDISENNIAWPQDISRFMISNQSQVWLNITSQRFMNWARIAAMPQFRKLWGRIQSNLQAGNYTLIINNNYNIGGFGGEKYFVVSQSNFFGSKNDFLSITYIAVGSLCFAISLSFCLKKIGKDTKKPQP